MKSDPKGMARRHILLALAASAVSLPASPRPITSGLGATATGVLLVIGTLPACPE